MRFARGEQAVRDRWASGPPFNLRIVPMKIFTKTVKIRHAFQDKRGNSGY